MPHQIEIFNELPLHIYYAFLQKIYSTTNRLFDHLLGANHDSLPIKRHTVQEANYE